MHRRADEGIGAALEARPAVTGAKVADAGAAEVEDVGERADLVRLEEGYGWRPGRRPVRPAPQIAVFLDLFDRAEQEELTYRTLAVGTVEELRNAFRRGLAPA